MIPLSFHLYLIRNGEAPGRRARLVAPPSELFTIWTRTELVNLRMAAQSRDSEKIARVEDHTVEAGKDSQEEFVTAVENEHKGPEPVVDYAGSAAKTDPREIELVRKLDFMMLVSVGPPGPLQPQTHCSWPV